MRRAAAQGCRPFSYSQPQRRGVRCDRRFPTERISPVDRRHAPNTMCVPSGLRSRLRGCAGGAPDADAAALLTSRPSRSGSPPSAGMRSICQSPSLCVKNRIDRPSLVHLMRLGVIVAGKGPNNSRYPLPSVLTVSSRAVRGGVAQTCTARYCRPGSPPARERCSQDNQGRRT